MNKQAAVTMVYQIATLTYPSQEVLDLLEPLTFERVLELMLILRQSQKTVKSPLNFLRRAVDEGWSAETMPQKINRQIQNHEEHFYMTKGYSQEEARKKAWGNQHS